MADLTKGRRVTGGDRSSSRVTCASGTRAARASVSWPRTPDARTASSTGSSSESGATLRGVAAPPEQGQEVAAAFLGRPPVVSAGNRFDPVDVVDEADQERGDARVSNGMPGGAWIDPALVPHGILRSPNSDSHRAPSAGSPSYARPYWRSIAAFLVLVVVDAVLVIASPLLFRGSSTTAWRKVTGARHPPRAARRPHRDRRLAHRTRDAAVLEPHRRGPHLSTSARRCSPTCSACRSPSSPAPRPAPSSPGSTVTSSAPSRPSPRPCREWSPTWSAWSSLLRRCSSSRGRSR